jgi:colanic acid/amylovoran biosynthesis glycosyltransferase
MSTIAYFANQFPSPVEPYVWEEISYLRARGENVVPCSARRPQKNLPRTLATLSQETVFLEPLDWRLCVRALGWCLWRIGTLRDLLDRILLRGREPWRRRAKALLHTWLGACLALMLRERRAEHIHVHHGYFGAWIAMVAARMLGITYSLTLHGSDLLLDAWYLDTKLANCSVCFTVSEYNACRLRERYPDSAWKVVLRRLGVAPGAHQVAPATPQDRCFVLLSVGRLNAVKNHTFLLDACSALQRRGVNFLCLIVGDGPEKLRLEARIRQLGLRREVKLLGELPHAEVESLYPLVDLLVLTSTSEGIPLVLMEAMAHGCAVLAPAITGIPELVIDGRTGFLYASGCLAEFVGRVELIRETRPALGPLKKAAWERVLSFFNRDTNLQTFSDKLLHAIWRSRQVGHENPALQQI